MKNIFFPNNSAVKTHIFYSPPNVMNRHIFKTMWMNSQYWIDSPPRVCLYIFRNINDCGTRFKLPEMTLLIIKWYPINSPSSWYLMQRFVNNYQFKFQISTRMVNFGDIIQWIIRYVLWFIAFFSFLCFVEFHRIVLQRCITHIKLSIE